MSVCVYVNMQVQKCLCVKAYIYISLCVRVCVFAACVCVQRVCGGCVQCVCMFAA